MQLFRTEAMRGQDRLHGEVVLVPPVSWQLLSGFLFAAVLIAAAFLASARYGKVTVADGVLTGDRGIVRAVAVRPGIVEQVLVAEGQRVEAGTPLARISIASGDGAETLQDRRAAAIARREEALRGSMPELARVARARVDALSSQIGGDRAEAAGLSAQIGQQRELVRSAAEELERARNVAERGFVSRRDVLQREELLATRRQGLSRLEQELASRRARIAAAEADLARARSELELQLADVAGARAELAGLAAADENATVLVVTAAEGGTVTGITAHRGDAVGPDRPILSIIPAGSRLQARIEVPAAAAGFLEPGQDLRIAVDAFPYHTYGTIDARIRSVSEATVPVARADGSSAEVFIVHADMRAATIDAYALPQPLRPGMTVSARITTRSRSLMEWLFDPLFAVGRR
ncbi:MAG: HlyD family secretion protein [Allosphingosinicella sp.]|uniref:HlyD family secretion protein n=1 Tax=Allosphingosinicella sp. TaxID=2823234 RepID=UPI003935D1A7